MLKELEQLKVNPNSLAIRRSDLLEYWDWEKNKISPYEINYKGYENDIIFLKCSICGYRWKNNIKSKAMCSECLSKKARIIKSENYMNFICYFGEDNIQVRIHKSALKISQKVLINIENNDRNFTDRLDLFSYESRIHFARKAMSRVGKSKYFIIEFLENIVVDVLKYNKIYSKEVSEPEKELLNYFYNNNIKTICIQQIQKNLKWSYSKAWRYMSELLRRELISGEKKNGIKCYYIVNEEKIKSLLEKEKNVKQRGV